MTAPRCARAAGCATAPVLRERGQREVFCGLTGIIWLHRKIQDAFFLVVGSRTCAHLIQSAAGVMIFAEPRFATAIIDERDLAGLADANAELDRVVTRLLERRPDIRLLFLVGSCPSEVIKLDLSRAARGCRAVLAARARAQLLRQRHRDDLHAGRGRLPRLAGAETCCRERRRRALAAGRRRARRRRRGPVRAPVRRTRHRPGAFPAAAPRRACRRSGPNTRFLLAQPFLADTARALEERGATRLPRPSRSAPKARRCGCRRRRDRLRRQRRARVRRASPRRDRERAQRALARYRAELAGKRVFFFPDSQLEIPLARFLARELACSWSRSARRTCTASTWPPSSRCCPPAPLLSEGQDVERSSTAAAPRARPRRLRPRPRQSARSRGLTTKWSIELVFTPIQGYEQAGDLAELFARRWCGARGWRPDMQLTVWTYEGPPHVGAMRIATAMRGRALRAARAAGRHLRRPAVHDDRAARERPPVTYTTFQARDLGGDTASCSRPPRAMPTSASSRRRCWSAPRAPPS
jgi:light-independent protochlorophyllide reductase subunit N